MEAEKKVFLCGIVEDDFTAGNESRLAYVEAIDDNAFVLHFRANSAEGLKGIKLKAGYQFNGETKDWTEEKKEEDSLLPLAVIYHKDLFVKMTGAKRGKTLLELNKAFATPILPTVKDKACKEETQGEAEHEEAVRADDSAVSSEVSDACPEEVQNEETAKVKEAEEEEELHIVIPDEAIDYSGMEKDARRKAIIEEAIAKDKVEVKAETHRPRDVEEMPVVKPSIGEDYDFREIPTVGKADEWAQAVEAKEEVKQEEVPKLAAQEVVAESEGADDAARGFVLDFILAIGKVKKFADMASILAKMTEPQWKVVQILMKTGAVKFAEWVKKALYENAKERKWGIVARVDAPTYKDLKDGVSGTVETSSEEVEEKQSETQKPTKVNTKEEPTIGIEQKPDVTVKTNFEDEDHEALNPHGRIMDLKRTLSLCGGFLPRSHVSISPDGDFVERW